MKVTIRHVKPIQSAGSMCIRVASSEGERTKVKDRQNICVRRFWWGKIWLIPCLALPSRSALYPFVSHGIT